MEIKILQIDEEFKNLIAPLQRKEFLQLEENILEDGCINPIITWKGYIIDGHNRYNICTKHNIPFETMEKDFSCRDAVIAWICKNQLGRRNISEETRKYLIGKQYYSEKNANKITNPNGYNQYQRNSNGQFENCSRHKTAQKIANENHVTHVTVSKYANFSKALDRLAEKVPEIVPKILSGSYKFSHNNIMELADMSTAEIKKVNDKMETLSKTFIPYSQSRNIMQNPNIVPETHKPSVKDMPEFDPDANYIKLALTVPSWVNIIIKTKDATDITIVSDRAKQKLTNVLTELQSISTQLLDLIKESSNG